ncbi:unnamed protein product [Hydatigera taeniaeformis]|uniref:Peptidase M12B domain-containing protein n=1 Tax=Hydatigena taeniaeformis TaxID=6205 RepID=A0A0R3WUW1_HYDTA|nr:unnamed protein product [Hydatigera taeniaeformis]
MLTPQAYLQEFAQRPDHGPHCLSHKLCWFSSRDGILALTYVCSAYKGRQLAGICAKRYFTTRLPVAIRGNTNTGFTSYLNTNGMPVPALSAELVMAHELGHSYGSLHDPDTPLCSPENERGGVYLLNKYAVSGMMPNHYVSSAEWFISIDAFENLTLVLYSHKRPIKGMAVLGKDWRFV